MQSSCPQHSVKKNKVGGKGEKHTSMGPGRGGVRVGLSGKVAFEQTPEVREGIMGCLCKV